MQVFTIQTLCRGVDATSSCAEVLRKNLIAIYSVQSVSKRRSFGGLLFSSELACAPILLEWRSREAAKVV